jgi:hypothetical protein
LEEGRRVLNKFAEGIPELEVDPMDPLYVGDIGTAQGPAGLVYKQYDVVIKGFKHSRLVDLR